MFFRLMSSNCFKIIRTRERGSSEPTYYAKLSGGNKIGKDTGMKFLEPFLAFNSDGIFQLERTIEIKLCLETESLRSKDS